MKYDAPEPIPPDLLYETLSKATPAPAGRWIGQLWLKSLSLQHSRKNHIRLVIIILLACVAYVDYLTGDYLVLFPFYALAIMVIGWYDGWAGALITVIIATVLEIGSDFMLHGGVQIIDDLNQVFRTALWLVIGYGAASMRSYVLTIFRQQSALSQALEKLKIDVDSAQMVQKALLEKPIPHDPRIDMAIRYTMAQELGGDYYRIAHNGDTLTLFIGDVSGKGPPAALVTALLCGLLEESGDRIKSPSSLLSLINERIYPYISEEFFITCFYGVVDLAGKKLTYASAGHDPPLLLRKSSGKVEEIAATGMPLGITSPMALSEEEILFQAGDVLVLYTDGFTNNKKSDGTRMDFEALKKQLEACQGCRAEDISSSLLAFASENTDRSPDDDTVLMVARFH